MSDRGKKEESLRRAIQEGSKTYEETSDKSTKMMSTSLKRMIEIVLLILMADLPQKEALLSSIMSNHFTNIASMEGSKTFGEDNSNKSCTKNGAVVVGCTTKRATLESDTNTSGRKKRCLEVDPPAKVKFTS